jgi:putative Holliday junction resolvase
MRAIGLDIGSKTIGIALTDEANIAAHPHSVLARAGILDDVSAVLTLIAKHSVTTVVVGVPFELSGKVGHRARRVLELAHAIKGKLPPGIAYVEQDERFTTSEAERALIATDARRDKRKSVIDQHAASFILRAWLEKQSAAK